MTEHNRQLTRDNERLRELVTELEDDLAAARTSLRRMIRDTNQPDTDQPQENP